MRAIVTGQIGVDKRPYLQAVQALATDAGQSLALYPVGDLMYAEAPDVRPGRILDLPLSRLHQLRRSVFRDIINQSADQPDIIVNTHATFRWRHGLFRAFDFDQIQQIKPDLFICLIDNAEAVYHRLHDEHIIDATLKDVMVWREEEIMATELLAQAMGCGNRFYILSRGRRGMTAQSAFRLICRPKMRKVYPSFPMSHVVGMRQVLAQIDAFRATLAEHFITFDPGDVDEKLLLEAAIAAVREGRDFVNCHAEHQGEMQTFQMPVKQVIDCAGDIDGQIYARDFKLIDQADMICSLVPQLPDGMPGLSSGVERELQHAFEASKDVYVIWTPARSPSPFITETATKVFNSVQQALDHFEKSGLLGPDEHLFAK